MPPCATHVPSSALATGDVAPFPKALAEMVAAVWLASRGDHERQVFARRRVEHRAQFGMHHGTALTSFIATPAIAGARTVDPDRPLYLGRIS
jgi:hypothetical protein